MNDLCAKCNVCAAFMPEQEEERTLEWWYGGHMREQRHVLFIDDCADKRDITRSLDIARDLVKSTEFVYTTTIRCDFVSGELDDEEVLKAEQRCAVWTHQLLEKRMLIISTEAGLRQMQLGEDKGVGDMWRNNRVGVVLCVQPLLRIPHTAIAHYQAKIERVLKKAEIA